MVFPFFPLPLPVKSLFLLKQVFYPLFLSGRLLCLFSVVASVNYTEVKIQVPFMNLLTRYATHLFFLFSFFHFASFSHPFLFGQRHASSWYCWRYWHHDRNRLFDSRPFIWFPSDVARNEERRVGKE